MYMLGPFTGGGQVEAIKFFIGKGADPNSIGAFRRTPLYRAAFAGHQDAVQVRTFGRKPAVFTIIPSFFAVATSTWC